MSDKETGMTEKVHGWMVKDIKATVPTIQLTKRKAFLITEGEPGIDRAVLVEYATTRANDGLACSS